MTLTDNRLSRRALLIRSLALGGAAYAAATLGAACAPAAQQSSSGGSPAGAPAAAGAPRRGGTLTWALWDNTDDIDPAVPTGSAALEITKNVLDTLVTMDANQKGRLTLRPRSSPSPSAAA